MIVRIVKMSFDPEKVNEFLLIFHANKDKIRHFNGCTFLELYQDKHQKNIFFTYSYWQSENHLESYRNSTTFATVWKSTKVLFNNKPQAWSVDKVVSLN